MYYIGGVNTCQQLEMQSKIKYKVQLVVVLEKVAGGILRGNRTNTQIPPSARNDLDQGRFNVKHLSYPLNVDTDNRQGHYIMFNINELKKSKVTIDEAISGKKMIQVNLLMKI